MNNLLLKRSLTTSASSHILLSKSLQGLSKSATLSINEKSAELKKQGKDVIKFGLGQSPFPVPNRMVQELRDKAEVKDYLQVEGLEPLREQVASFFRRKHSIQADPSDVLVGPGSKELLFLAQLAFSGRLWLPNPSWVSYGPQHYIVGKSPGPLWIDTSETEWKLTPENLEKACKEQVNDSGKVEGLLILNYPSNPTGQTYNATELKDLANVARRYGLLVLADEIYSYVTFEEGLEHSSIATHYPEGTIISNGISKWAGAGGWRCGVFVFPKELSWLKDAMCVVSSETFTSVSAPIQNAAIKAFEESTEMDVYLRDSNRVLKAVSQRVVTDLRSCGLEVIPPMGGFYAMPDWSPIRERLRKKHQISSSSDLALSLLDKSGVALLPGTCFGLDEDKLFTRLAFVDFDGDQALKAAKEETSSELPPSFVDKFCPRICMGMEKIRDFVA